MSLKKEDPTAQLKGVVGIGVTTESRQALEELFQIMPSDTGCAFVVVQEKSSSYKALQKEELAHHTTIPVVDTKDGAPLKPNHIYWSPTGTKITFEGEPESPRLKRQQTKASKEISPFFKNMAESQGAQAITILLSAENSDLLQGAETLHKAGAFVISLTPEVRQFGGMTQSIRLAHCSSALNTLSEIPKTLISYLANQAPQASHKTPLKSEVHAYDMILTQHLPASLLLSDKGKILHYIGAVERFLEPPNSSTSTQVLDRVSGELKTALSALIDRLNRNEKYVEYSGIRSAEKPSLSIKLIGKSIYDPPSKTCQLHVLFEYTANDKTEGNLTAHDHAHNSLDYNDIIENTDIGLLFIDRDLRIRKFNQSILNIVELLPKDGGEHLENIKTQLVDKDLLVQTARSVILNRKASQKEITTRTGDNYLMRVFPFSYPQEGTEEAIISFSYLEKKKNSSSYFDNEKEEQTFIIENNRQGLWEANPSKAQFHFSDSCYKLLDYPLHSLDPSFEDWRRLIHPEDQKSWWQYFAQQIQKDEEFCAEFRMQDGHQNWRWFLCRGRVCERNEDQQATRVLGLMTDITELKELALTLRETEKKLALSMQSADQVWWEWDIENKRITTHGIHSNILGYDLLTLDKLEGFWWDRIPKEELPIVKRSLEDHFKGWQKNWRCEHRFSDEQGNYHWVIQTGSVTQRDAQGKPQKMLGITQYNDSYKKIQIESEQNKAFYHSIIEDQNALICRYGSDFTFTYINRAYSDFFGKSAKQLIGKSCAYIFDENAHHNYHSRLMALKPESPHQVTVEKVVSHKGSKHWIQWTERAFFDSNRRLIGYQSIGSDITQLKKSEEKLYQLLEETKKTKDNFQTVMSYKVRTHLYSIIGGSNLLGQATLSPEGIKLVEMIHSSGERLLQLINSALSLSDSELPLKTSANKKVKSNKTTLDKKTKKRSSKKKTPPAQVEVHTTNFKEPKPRHSITLREATALLSTRILIVDDEEPSRSKIQTLLKNHVATCDVAKSGLEAIKKTQEKQYDIILIDVHMPHKNGFETAQAICNRAKKHKIVKIIYITEDNRNIIKEKAEKTTPNAPVLFKPVSFENLANAMVSTFIVHKKTHIQN